MKILLAGLRAAGEQTRLRILAALSQGELTVSELTRVLNQSQPRVSRHLKLLSEAGLIERIQEGAWVFYRLASSGPGAELACALLGFLEGPDSDLKLDRMRLDHIRHEHAAEAQSYFNRSASDWDRIRRLHIHEADVEKAMLRSAQPGPINKMVDIGTGTGRILEIFADHCEEAMGIDSSSEMLALARSKLLEAGLSNCQVRRGDARQLTMDDHSADLVTIHHVLHFLDEPATVIREAARILSEDGKLLVVDFLPHHLEFLRSEFAHRRLGFSDQEITEWCRDAGLRVLDSVHLKGRGDRRALTVGIWCCKH